MDDLVASLAAKLENGDIIEDGKEHPHFASFKNKGKVAENQRRRREEHLSQRAKAREQWLDRYRNCFDDAEPVTNAFESRNRRKYRGKPNPYANCLMLSDWLVDIPATLSHEWTMVPAPIGHRGLVVAQKGLTCIYRKDGNMLVQFESGLPGGNRHSSKGLTMLDCIHKGRIKDGSQKVYLLDLLWWNNTMYTDTEFTCRHYILQSKINESDELQNDNSGCQFIALPSCPCSPESIRLFMQIDFPYDLDGLLFYYNSGYYISEQTPLVGWLKAWMLPEILGVPIPNRFVEDVKCADSRKYIENFNKKHNHTSSAEKKMRAEARKQQSIDNGEPEMAAEEGVSMSNCSAANPHDDQLQQREESPYMYRKDADVEQRNGMEEDYE